MFAEFVVAWTSLNTSTLFLYSGCVLNISSCNETFQVPGKFWGLLAFRRQWGIKYHYCKFRVWTYRAFCHSGFGSWFSAETYNVIFLSFICIPFDFFIGKNTWCGIFFYVLCSVKWLLYLISISFCITKFYLCTGQCISLHFEFASILSLFGMEFLYVLFKIYEWYKYIF